MLIQGLLDGRVTTGWWVLFSVVMTGQASPAQDSRADEPEVYRNWQTFSKRDGLPDDRIRVVRVSGDQVWVGTERGLAQRTRDGWRSWTIDDGLPSPLIASMDVDAQTEDVWLGTWGGGLARLSGGHVDVFSQMNSGLAGDLVFAVVVHGGCVWVATTGGVSAFSPVTNTWRLYFERRADASETAVTSLISAAGGLYAGTWCGRVWHYDGAQDRWLALGGTPPPPTTPDEGLLELAATGQLLWKRTRGDLYWRVGSGPWEKQPLATPGPAENVINCLAAPNQGEVWLGTNAGLYLRPDWREPTLMRYHLNDPQTATRVTLIREGRTDVSHTLSAGLPGERVACVAFQGNDVWVGTSNGLALGRDRVRWDEVHSIAAASAQTVPPPLPHTSEPTGLDAVGVGVIGPRARNIMLPGEDWREIIETGRADLLAVQLAIDEANAQGGYRGKTPFAPVVGHGRYVRYGWGAPEDDYGTFAIRDGLFGMIGYLEPDNRIAAAVALKTEVPLMNVCAAPVAFPEMVNPWIFRCLGDQQRRHRQLIDYLIGQLGHRRLAVLRPRNHSARPHLDWWVGQARGQGRPVVTELSYDPKVDDLDSVLETLRGAEARVVLTWYDEVTSAEILRRMREMGMSQLFVGSDRIVGDGFLKHAGPDPGAVIAPVKRPTTWSHEGLAEFTRKYAERNLAGSGPRGPNENAYRSYHAAHHLMAAINVAGLDRAAIRRTLEQLRRYPKGEHHYERACPPAELTFARIEDGAWRVHQTGTH